MSIKVATPHFKPITLSKKQSTMMNYKKPSEASPAFTVLSTGTTSRIEYERSDKTYAATAETQANRLKN